MNRRPLRLLGEVALVVLDAKLVSASFVLAYWARFRSGLLEAPKGTPPLAEYLPGIAVACVLFVFAFRSHDLYRSRRARSALDEIGTILRAVLVGTLLTMAAAFFYRGFSYSRLVFVFSWAIASALVPAGRLLFRMLQRALLARGIGQMRVAIVGTGEMGALLARKIASHPSLGYDVTGFIAAEEAMEEPPSAEGPSGAGLRAESAAAVSLRRAPLPAPVLGSVGRVEAIVHEAQLDRLLVALPLASHHRMLDILAACDRLPVEVQFVPDLFEIMTQRVRVSEIDGIPLLAIRDYPLDAWNRIVKRTFDIAFSSAALLVGLPLMAAVAAAVKLGSPGPALFRQRRVGRDGREFTMLKFRSMPVDAESATGPVIADANDPRATTLGRFLRRSSLDELPQFWNVLVGEMSLVGPRPERQVFVEQFDRAVPRYFSRHQVKSGVTGWAQVNGLRGTTSIEERTKFDIFYVENWSLLFDLKILFLTARQVLFANRPPSAV